jgi:signal peptidase II
VVGTVVVTRPAQARRRAFARAGGVLAIVIGLDQLTKHTIAASVHGDQVKHVVPGLTLVHVENSGVAFGFLAGGGAIVYVVTGAALLALLGFLFTRPERRLLWLPTGMLVGGAVGNVIDRVADGSVIDFIKLPDWPAFNCADISITFGVIVLAVLIEFGARGAGRGGGG